LFISLQKGNIMPKKTSLPVPPAVVEASVVEAAVPPPTGKTKIKPQSAVMNTPSESVAKPAATKEAKEKKAIPKKTKLIRDSFTFPENDYALIGTLKQRALSTGRDIKKSELLRAGLTALGALPESDLLKALDAVERIKTGRPAK
jgi:hypothetical protein